MKTSKTGLDLIKTFEGCRLKAYKCPADVWTIGYGHTGSDVKQGMVITQAEADRLLQQDLERFEKNVMKFANKYHWTQNEFDALVSFAFNVGSIDQLVSNGNRTKAQIAEAITKYNKAGGKVLAGLVRRRKAEQELFLKEDDTVDVKKITVIVDGVQHQIDGVFNDGLNYVSIRQLVAKLDYNVSNKGSTPVLTKK